MVIPGDDDQAPVDKDLEETQRLLDEMDTTMKRVRFIVGRPPAKQSDDEKKE
jgi:hypothetical protein